MLSQALSKSKDPAKADVEPAPIDQALPETAAEDTAPIAKPVQEGTDVAEPPPDPDDVAPPPVPDEPTLADPGPAVQSRPASSYRVSVDEAQDIILRGLRRLPDFPSQGVVVTLYGSRPWNAMLTFAPGSTSYRNATIFRSALADMISELRKQIDIDQSA